MAAVLFYQKGPSYTAKRIPFILVFVAVILFTAPKEQLDRMMSIFDGGSDSKQVSLEDSRLGLWKLSLLVIQKNPILGCGISQLTDANGKSEGGNWHTAHNSYLQIGAELGVFGIWSFLAMLLFSWRSLCKESFNLKRPWLVDGIKASLLVLCIGSMFLSWAFITATYFIVALTIIVHKISLQNRRTHVEQSTQQSHLAPGIPEAASATTRGGPRTRFLLHMRPF